MDPETPASHVMWIAPPDQLLWNGLAYKCALGKGGITPRKREGDGATPAGYFTLRRLFYRPDRLPAPETGLISQALNPEDGWCDEPAHDAYNQLVTRPFPASNEQLWRDDHIYDLIVEVGYNDDPIRAGNGSAIFMHIARCDYEATNGCVALRRDNLLQVLRGCGPVRSSLFRRRPERRR